MGSGSEREMKMFCKTILYNFYVSLLSSDCPTSVEYLAEEGFALWTGFGIFSIAQQGTQQSADWNTEEPVWHFYGTTTNGDSTVVLAPSETDHRILRNGRESRRTAASKRCCAKDHQRGTARWNKRCQGRQGGDLKSCLHICSVSLFDGP